MNTGHTDQMTTDEAVKMSIFVGFAGSVASVVVAIGVAMIFSGVDEGLPPSETVIDAILRALLVNAQWIVLVVGVVLTAREVVNTILHNRDQYHDRQNKRLDKELLMQQADIDYRDAQTEHYKLKVAELNRPRLPAYMPTVPVRERPTIHDYQRPEEPQAALEDEIEDEVTVKKPSTFSEMGIEFQGDDAEQPFKLAEPAFVNRRQQAALEEPSEHQARILAFARLIEEKCSGMNLTQQNIIRECGDSPLYKTHDDITRALNYRHYELGDVTGPRSGTKRYWQNPKDGSVYMFPVQPGEKPERQ
jgi:cell division protein FtsL